MPELPEVEGVVRALRPVVEGKTIERVTTSSTIQTSYENGKESIVKKSSPQTFAKALVGMQITEIERRAKYIFFHLMREGNRYLFVNHLGMTGAWFTVNTLAEITEDKFRRHAHVIIQFTDKQLLVYADIRRFGECRLIEKISDHPPLLKMAPEPFVKEAEDFFIEQSEKTKYANKAIKEVIMDGQVISGCGNIYATEALFTMKINPLRKTSQISESSKRLLFHAIVNILQESIDFGGSSISDYRNINGEAGTMQNRLKMYGRKQCPICQSETTQVSIGGRTSTYCDNCQQ